MQVLHVHRVNGGEDVRRTLNDALSSLRQDHWSARSQEDELVAVADWNERQEVTLYEDYLCD